MTDLSASYAHCRRLARQSASSFYYSFLLLPRPKRAAMYALYAYLRRTDDLGDSDQPLPVRQAELAAWRDALDRAWQGDFVDPLLPALVDAIERFEIPRDVLMAVIEGVEMDLAGRQYRTFAELEEYCYRVASAVGLACIHIWGFRSSEAIEPARQCGVAFQLTNILRDLKEDAERGRIYLPQEDLDRFGYRADELRAGVDDSRFRALMQFEIERTENLYLQASRLERWLEPEGRRIFAAMMATYGALLAEIKRRSGDVLQQRVRLSWWRKLRLTSRGLMPLAALPSSPREVRSPREVISR